ncbi:hypothetical protein D3C81_1949630 [compost metagenome]
MLVEQPTQLYKRIGGVFKVQLLTAYSIDFQLRVAVNNLPNTCFQAQSRIAEGVVVAQRQFSEGGAIGEVYVVLVKVRVITVPFIASSDQNV